ncbi:MAG: UDP-N-acetylmuramoyl-tripeptide--D-alanyl-D-alanine ligase [Treponema sp.]|jgi:UDP-N-acetylmuramoyl-tripeptide--D-alanyl-D-alanine ligase|nr:UDP-N-acetylmuramoyl-tripeptide--D-alanyl-D-alanine ligase [Treponema sp.]
MLEAMSQDTDIIDCSEISQALGFQLISFKESGEGSAAEDTEKKITSVSIDSRIVLPGALFVALIGTAQDGHRYIQAAFEAGAVAAMISRSRWEAPTLGLEEIARKFRAVLLVTEDTLKGLQDVASYYLTKFPQLLKIGITGSSGKTTTKEILATILSQEKIVVATQGNLNSETGLPLSVFTVRSYHQVGIFELGMNRYNEIEELAKVLKPHIALITNIGSAHIGFFGDKLAIAKEKKAIFSQFSGSEIALIPADDPYRDFLAKGVKGRIIFHGPMKELDGTKDQGINGFEILWDGVSIHFNLPGMHNLRNALAATAIAKEVPVSSRSIQTGLKQVTSLFGRTQIICGPITVIQDCYNANPESMIAAIHMCDMFDKAGRKIYVIGSMLELGDASQEAHKMIGQYLVSAKVDLVCLYGEETRIAFEVLKSANDCRFRIAFFHRIDELLMFLIDFIQFGDLVLLKGSRLCALEQLTNGLMTAALKRIS